MGKRWILPLLSGLFILITGITAFAGDYSSAWYQEGGNWRVKGPDGQPLKNCWFCDDAVFTNGKNIWYLLDAEGNMVSHPLVRDAKGNYYSLETDHNGIYGSLRYQNGYYDDILMNFSQKHDGTFGALIKPSAIEELSAIYGVKDISGIDPSSCYYSADWLGADGTPATAENTSGMVTEPGGTVAGVADNAYRSIRYEVKGKVRFTDSGNTRYFTVKNLAEKDFDHWADNMGDRYYPGEVFCFEGNRTSALFIAIFEP